MSITAAAFRQATQLLAVMRASAICQNQSVAENADDGRSPVRRGGKKDRKLEQFIEGLLSSPNVESAAASAGISARTAWRWMRDETVRERLRETRQQRMQHAMMRLQSGASAAVTCLCELQASGESESAKVSAARTILEMALRSAEIGDIAERLARLEQLAKNNWRPNDHRPDHAQIGTTRRTNGPA
jgi:hypothetical protein